MNEPGVLDNANESLHYEEEKIDTDTDRQDGSDIESANVSESNEETVSEESSPDYEAIARDDMLALKAEFPELANIDDITELDNPLRYAALRDLGLTPREAYLATVRHKKRDNRSHLYATHAVSASQSGVMPESELMAAREIFTDVSDAQIRKLYKRVTK